MLRGPTLMTTSETPGRRKRYAQIYVSPEIAKRLDAVRVQFVIRTEREWTKTQINDALLSYALDHLDEVTAALPEEAPDDE